MKLKFTLAGALLAFFLSVAIGMAIGNSLSNLLGKAVMFAALFAGMSYFSMQYLEKRVPEIFSIQVSSRSETITPPLEPGSAEESSSASVEADEYIGQSGNVGANMESGTVVSGSVGAETKNLGDHILIRDKKIKNEPKLIAEAIRQMILREDE